MKRLLVCLLCVLCLGCSKEVEPGKYVPVIAVSIGFAADGIVVAPATPVSNVCPSCGGTGKVGDGRTMLTCQACNGTGKIDPSKAISDMAHALGYFTDSTSTALEKIAEAASRPQVTFQEQCVQVGDKIVCTHADGSITVHDAPPQLSKEPKTKDDTKLDWTRDLEEAKRTAKRLDRNIFVAFSTGGCKPCERVQREVYGQWNETSTAIYKQMVPLKWFTVKGEASEAYANSLGVDSYPSYAILTPEGKLIKSGVASSDPVYFAKQIQQ